MALPAYIRFMKVYVNLPVNLRSEVIVVIDKKPLSWDVAYLEVKNHTKIGAKILKVLDDLEFI